MEAFCYAKYMSQKLIIIRGNSGSGKSTVARLLRDELGENAILVPQDVIRRDILHVKDRENNPAIDLISRTVVYGKEIGKDVVLEGILSKKLYGNMLERLTEHFDNVYAFYMDVSFEETLKRHNSKPNRHEYGAEKMREWWIEKDHLLLPSETIIPEEYSPNDAVNLILEIIESSKLVH